MFNELLNRAMNDPENIGKKAALADWLLSYNMSSWNGECWDLENGYKMTPVYSSNECGDGTIVDYVISLE